MDEKRAHAVEIQQTAAGHAPRRAELDAAAAEYAKYDRLLRP